MLGAVTVCWHDLIKCCFSRLFPFDYFLQPSFFSNLFSSLVAKLLACLLQAAQQQSPDACYQLGVMAEIGEGLLVADHEEAVAWYRQAAALGSIQGMHSYAFALEHGIGQWNLSGYACMYTPAYCLLSTTALRPSHCTQYLCAETTCGPNETVLAVNRSTTRICPQNQECAQTISKSFIAAHAYDGKALLKLICFTNPTFVGTTQDVAAAVHWYTQAATAGHAASSNNLGRIYYDGLHGIQKDLLSAVHLLTRAAEQGSVLAWYNLGVCYEEGGKHKQLQGSTNNPECCQRGGDTPGGNSLQRGNVMTTPIDEDLAMQCYEKAAQQGHSNAHVRLGKLQLKRNCYSAAKHQFSAAAASGNVEGMLELATLAERQAMLKGVSASDRVQQAHRHQPTGMIRGKVSIRGQQVVACVASVF